MRTEMYRRIDLAGLRDFVMQRAQADGGFAATPMQPHTIQDTFFAVEILSCLSSLRTTAGEPRSFAVDSTRAYLARFTERNDRIPLKTAYQISRLCRHLDLSLDLHWHADRRGTCPLYEELFYEEALGAGEGVAAETDHFAPQRRTVRELCFFLQLHHLRSPGRVPAERDSLARWLQRCQGPDGGFGFFPGTTSYIENSHYALAGLAMLHRQPADRRGVTAFIVSCQTASGGFSRNSRAAPFLDASWHALQAIRSLQQA